MEIIWEWSIESEVNRLLQSTRNIGNGFYALQNFYPLSWDPNIKYLSNGVYLPHITYNEIPSFWSRISRLDDHHLPILGPTSITLPLTTLLTDLHLASPDYHALDKSFKYTAPQVIAFMKQTFPMLSLPKQITIYPTYFGTTGSFNWMTENGEIVIYNRVDQGIRSLVECMLTSIIRPHAASNGGVWIESESLVDYLIQYSALNSFIPQDPSWSPTCQNIKKSNKRLQQLSQDFLTKIGAPTKTSQKFTVKENIIYYGKKPLTSFNHKESSLMEALISISPSPLSIDEVGDLLFAHDEKFSLSAISKTIERLRKKLSTLGISSSFLATSSGIGYYLKN